MELSLFYILFNSFIFPYELRKILFNSYFLIVFKTNPYLTLILQFEMLELLFLQFNLKMVLLIYHYGQIGSNITAVIVPFFIVLLLFDSMYDNLVISSPNLYAKMSKKCHFSANRAL